MMHLSNETWAIIALGFVVWTGLSPLRSIIEYLDEIHGTLNSMAIDIEAIKDIQRRQEKFGEDSQY